MLRYPLMFKPRAFSSKPASGQSAESSSRRAASAWCLASLMLSLATAAVADGNDGVWQLSIDGHHRFVFGERGFGGGVHIPWEIKIEFDVSGGAFGVGSGRARWLEPISAVSAPEGWFSCQSVEGSYLDSNLEMHATPRVRFAAFPVAGMLRDGRVALEPGYQPPGNYLAVTYRCETDSAIAENWFAVAERAKQVHGKRQDVETQRRAARPSARVREVAVLPPEHLIDLPLVDGWRFSEGDSDGVRQIRYRLRRIE